MGESRWTGPFYDNPAVWATDADTAEPEPAADAPAPEEDAAEQPAPKPAKTKTAEPADPTTSQE